MSFLNESATHAVPNSTQVELESQTESHKWPLSAGGSEDEKITQHRSRNAIIRSNSEVVLVDFEENDPANPVNWSPTHKWSIVFVISWMGFVR